MAANDSQCARVTEKDAANGHEFNLLVPIRYILGLRPKTFIHEHHNNCSRLPTSWKVQVTYKQNPDKKYVYCQLSLQRTDNGNDDVDVSATVSFLNKNDVEIISPKWSFSVKMLPGEVSEESIEIGKYPGYRGHIFLLGLVLKLSISIVRCHSAVVVYAKPRQDKAKTNKILQSKL